MLKGLKKATVALGRKLAVIMHRMLIKQEKFRYGDPKEKEAFLVDSVKNKAFTN